MVDRILIVKLGSIGDVVHALPMLVMLRRAYPRAHIAWLVEPASKDLVMGHRALDEVMVFERDRRSFRRSVASYLAAMRSVRRGHFDAVIDVQGITKSALLAWASGARVRVGFERGSSRVETVSTWFTNVRVDEGPNPHILERYLELAGALGARKGTVTFDVPVREEAGKRVDAFLDEKKTKGSRLVVFHPGTTWQSKRWPLERYAELADEIQSNFCDTCIVVSAGPGEELLASQIERLARSEVFLFTGRTLRELVALLERASLVVAPDTGPLHIGAALGRPVVGLYGPTDPRRNGPYGPRTVVVSAGLDCSGCWRKRCDKGDECMRLIGVSQVMEKIKIGTAPIFRM